MRKIIIVVFIFTIIFSCEKSTDFCESGECQKYFKIWKDIFISRNQLSESYFNDHVFPYRTDIDSWNDGKSFRVEYKIKIDWAEANLSDQFIIWIDPSTTGLYPSIPTPRSTYLSKDQIAKLFKHSQSCRNRSFIIQLPQRCNSGFGDFFGCWWPWFWGSVLSESEF
jgi:hypothetical protein